MLCDFAFHWLRLAVLSSLNHLSFLKHSFIFFVLFHARCRHLRGMENGIPMPTTPKRTRDEAAKDEPAATPNVLNQGRLEIEAIEIPHQMRKKLLRLGAQFDSCSGVLLLCFERPSHPAWIALQNWTAELGEEKADPFVRATVDPTRRRHQWRARYKSAQNATVLFKSTHHSGCQTSLHRAQTTL